MKTVTFICYKKIVSVDSFFLFVVFIIGLAQNIDSLSVRYCFFYGGHYLSTITTSIYVRNRYLHFIFDYRQFSLDINLGNYNQDCLISQIKEKNNILLKI